MNQQSVAEMRRQLIAFAVKRPVMTKVKMAPLSADATGIGETAAPQAVVLPYKPVSRKATPARAALRILRQRQAVAAAR